MTLEIIQKFKPINIQEETDKSAMIEFISKNDDYLSRSNLIAHFTNSAIIVNKKRDKVLFINHLIYKSWGWVGGHNDNNPDFLRVVIKEAKEETGLLNVYPIKNEPVSLDIINVPSHIKNNKYVGDHLHMNLSFLLEADENELLTIKEDENSGVKWFLIKDVLNHVTEDRMKYIYTKIFNILK